jgi:cold shock CspA family protein
MGQQQQPGETKMNKWTKGKVRWFDGPSGWGVITDRNGERYEVHFSAISMKSNTKILQEESEVKFKKFDDPDYKLITEVIVLSPTPRRGV